MCVVRRGHLNGPYLQEGANRDVYRWKSAARADIESVIAMLHPWLGPVKRRQSLAVFEVLRAQPALPRGRPEWGSHKTHCINGHEYANTRIRPYVSRGAGRQWRENHQCLQCAREQARARRAKKKTGGREDHRSLSEPRLSYYLLK